MVENPAKRRGRGHREDALGGGPVVHDARGGGMADKIVRGGGRAVDEARGGGRVAHEARGGALDTGDAGGLLVHVLNASEVVSEIAHWPLNGVQKPR